MWTLSGVGVVFFHYCYFLSIYPVTQEIPVKIPYLSERKVKFFTERVRENNLELHTGLHCGLWAAASATLSSVQGVNSQPGMAVFAATVTPGAVVGGTAALPHLPKLQGCYRLWEEMKFFQWSWTWSKRCLWDATCLSAQGLMSWSQGMKDSSTGDVRPLLCSKVCPRSLGTGSHTAGLFRHTITFGAVLENSPLQQHRREVQVSGKVMEQEKGTLILL